MRIYTQRQTCIFTTIPLRALFVLALLFCTYAPAAARAQPLTIWANDGGDKVLRDELRATAAPDRVLSSFWDGANVKLFGARNEVVGASLIIEAPQGASALTVTLPNLIGPGGARLTSRDAGGDGVFNWVGREIELFYVRYVQIRGLSLNTWQRYDERHIPERMRRPFTGQGYGQGGWSDRPGHDRYFPEIAVPLELTPQFDVAPGTNQAIWIDIYVPKDAPAGHYTGSIEVRQGGSLLRAVGVDLTVRNFALPDVPSSKTMVVYSPQNLNNRFFAQRYVAPLGPDGPRSIRIRDRYFQLAHRHKISLIDTNYDYVGDAPAPYEWPARLDGSLFTAAHGYAGPGTATGNNVFSVGTYGVWNQFWSGDDQAATWRHTDNWERWFQQNSPATERFIYLTDETQDFAAVERWAKTIRSNPGPGGGLMSFATVQLPEAAQLLPSLSIAASTLYLGAPSTWENAQRLVQSDPARRVFLYNGHRPASGTFATEDDGVALRELPWGQFKKGIDRWYVWEGTYYSNYLVGQGETDVFSSAHTFGLATTNDPVLGESGALYSNGDGLLFYPGMDRLYPASSYGVDGPIASLRLKHWRRGIQDVDYLTLARAVDPAATKAIVDAVVPRVLWEYGVADPADPSWQRTDVSWPTDPQVWDAARLRLAEIIERGNGSTPPADLTPPAAPGGLSGTVTEERRIRLRWDDASTNESGFLLERAVGDAPFASHRQLPANATTFDDVPATTSAVTYRYRLRAINASGSSGSSNIASVEVPAGRIPDPPSRNPDTPSTGGSDRSLVSGSVRLSDLPARALSRANLRRRLQENLVVVIRTSSGRVSLPLDERLAFRAHVEGRVLRIALQSRAPLGGKVQYHLVLRTGPKALVCAERRCVRTRSAR